MHRIPEDIALAALVLASCVAEPVDYDTCGQQPSCGSGPTYAIDSVEFVFKDEAGFVDGFDLDGSVSDEGDGLGCRVVDDVSPDGARGVDNRLPGLLSMIGPAFADAASASFRNAVLTGSMLTLLEFVPTTGTEGPLDGLVLRRGAGAPLLGADKRYLPLQTIAVEPQPRMAIARGQGTTDSWTSTEPFDVDFRLDFLGKPLRFPLHGSKVRLTSRPDGRLSLLFGGYILVSDAIGLAAFLGGCDAGTGELIKSVLPELADIRSTQDECDAISVALRFEAVPVFVFPEVHSGPLEGDWLFARSGCQQCHSAGDLPRTGLGDGAGPDLHHLAERASKRVAGVSAEAYVRQSILEPGAHVVEGFTNTMPAPTLAEGDADRLVEWLLAQ